MKKINIKDNINLYYLESDKFKTFSISFYFTRPLCKEEVSYNALIPYILKQGSVNYPDNERVSATLEELYGGIFDCNVRKKGDCQVIGFSFEFISPEFVRENSYKKKIYDFIFDILFNPRTENGGFIKEVCDREKKNQIDFINGIINDKKEYASLRCAEEMFKGEAYSLFAGGDVNDIENAGEKELYEQYKVLVGSSPLSVFVSGNIDIDEIENRLSMIERDNPGPAFLPCSYKKHSGEINNVTEKMDVNQGKLCMGFVTNIENSSLRESAALTVFNSVFGSGAHSKLFNNVREKLSLCYYAASRINKFKGTMSVSSGVEFENFGKAYDEILVQLDNMKKGEIEDWEINAAKSALVSILESYSDNPAATEDFYFTKSLMNDSSTVEDFIDMIKKITKDEISDVAKKIQLDTVYRLTGKDE